MSFVRCFISFLLYTINTVVWFVPIFICGLIKLIPIKPLQKLMSLIAKKCASIWVSCNSINQKLLTPYQLNVTGLENTKLKDWYLVIANHQSWVDILVLQRVFNRRIPFFKLLFEKRVIVRAYFRPCLVGTGLPIHDSHQQKPAKKEPKAAWQRFRNYPQGLRKV